MRWPGGTTGWVLGAALALVVLWSAYFIAITATAKKPSESQAQHESVTQSGPSSPTKQQQGDHRVEEEIGGETDAP